MVWSQFNITCSTEAARMTMIRFQYTRKLSSWTIQAVLMHQSPHDGLTGSKIYHFVKNMQKMELQREPLVTSSTQPLYFHQLWVVNWYSLLLIRFELMSNSSQFEVNLNAFFERTHLLSCFFFSIFEQGHNKFATDKMRRSDRQC